MSFIEGRFWWGTYVRDDDPELLATVLNKKNKNQLDQNEHHVVRVCLDYLSLSCLSYALSLKPDINRKTSHSKSSLIHLAVYNAFPEALELLCKYDSACINSRDYDGYTPLLRTIGRSDGYECAMVLLKYGANPCLKDTNNFTPLDLLSCRNVMGYLKQCKLEEALVLAGGWYHRIKLSSPWLLDMKKSAANCRLASRSLERVLKWKGMHKDLIPLMVNMVEENMGSTKIWYF